MRGLLRSPKDKDPFGSPGVYEIPCDCGKSYIGETGRNISVRLSEHVQSVRKRDTNASAVAEHSITGCTHIVRFDKVRVLAREKNYMSRKIREAIEIDRRPNFNRDKGWFVPPTWKPILCSPLRNKYVPNSVSDTISVVCLSAPISDNSTPNVSTSMLTSPSHPSSTRSSATVRANTPEPLPSARALRAARRSASRNSVASAP